MSMGLEAPLSPGPQSGRTSADALSVARTVLLLVPDSHRAGEILFALQRKRLPAVVAETATDALFWVRQEPPALTLVDMRAERARMLVDHLRGEGRPVAVLSDDPSARAAALELGCLEAEPTSVT